MCKCKRCNKKLQNAKSAELGYGPTCHKKHKKEVADLEFEKMQITIFDILGEKKEFTYASAFAGIGGMTMGLEQLGGRGVIAWEYDPTSKRQYAQEAHRLLHPHVPVEGDICKVDTSNIPDFDVFCFTPPCQSFSQAGKRRGFEDTRGTLTFEALRIAKDKQPKVLFMENVKGLVNHDKGNTLGVIIAAINDIGYTLDFTILNSKYFDVAQNRERIYLVAIRDDLITPEPWIGTEGKNMLPKAKKRYQEEGAKTFNFDWPEQMEVRTRLKDFLETKVDEKYYLSEDKTARLISQLEEGLAIKEATKQGFTIANEGDAVNIAFPNSDTRRGRVGKGIANTIEASGINQGVVEKVGDVNPSGSGMDGNVFSMDAGLCLTLTTNKGEGIKFLEDDVAILDTRNKSADIKSGKSGVRIYCDICPTVSATEQKDTKKVIESVNYIGSYAPDKLRSNGKPKYLEVYGVLHSDGQSQTLKTGVGGNQEPKILEEVIPVITPDRLEKKQNGRRFKDDGEESFTLTAIDRHGIAIGEYPKYSIRKLTPRECLRLQSVSEENTDKLLGNFSDSRCYKFAGNGLTTNVIKAIGEKILKYISL